MKTAMKFIVSGGLLMLGAQASWADPAEQKAYEQRRPPSAAEQKPHERGSPEEIRAELHNEIASPISGDFATANQFSAWGQPDIGGFSGNGFIGANGQPMSNPTNPVNPGFN